MSLLVGHLGTFVLHQRVHAFEMHPGQEFTLDNAGTILHLTLAPDLPGPVRLRLSGLRAAPDDPTNTELRHVYFELSPVIPDELPGESH